MIKQRGRSLRPRMATLLGLSLGLVLLAGVPLVAQASGTPRVKKNGKDSCVACHSDPKFLVQNKKLYDYYQAWKHSIHEQENVTCVDCHGGNPNASDKASAHAGKVMGAGQPGSPINYKNIPATCARCHKDIYRAFRQSLHYQHLQAGAQEEQGPNCVTCHGSVNTQVLNVNTVRNTCMECHNDRTGNHPGIPNEAETVLSNFLSIHRYYRFIGSRGSPEEVKSMFKIIDPVIKKLTLEWHTFNIDKVRNDTHNLVEFLKEQREDIRRKRAARKPAG